MARLSAQDRFGEVIEAAIAVFAARGYRATQLGDVAAALGLASPSALYSYVESKDALFYAVIDRALRTDNPPAVELPIPTKPLAAILERLRERAPAVTELSKLALARDSIPADAAEELIGVLGEFYEMVTATASVLDMLERSALDLPELAQAYAIDVRRPILDRLESFIEQRCALKLFRAGLDAAVAARMVLETITWFARTERDRTRFDLPDRDARPAVIDLVAHSLLP